MVVERVLFGSPIMGWGGRDKSLGLLLGKIDEGFGFEFLLRSLMV